MLSFLRKLNPYRHRAYIRELLALRAQRGPYRFAVKNWQGISDIELAARVLQVESFKSELDPLPLPIESAKSILVLAPHQDDEAIGAGGSLFLAGKAGANIEVVYVTDGEQNKVDQPADLKVLREREATGACRQLGAKMHQLRISNLLPQPALTDVDLLAEIIASVKPEIVMAPWLLDSPSKHRLVNHLLWLAHKRAGVVQNFEVWGYQVHNTPFVNGYIDITSVADKKRGLLECYQSQTRFCRYDHMAMGLAAWNARLIEGTPNERYLEVFFALPGMEFFSLLERFYFRDFAQTYRGDSTVIGGAREIHRAVLKANSGQKRRAPKTQWHGIAVKNCLTAALLLAEFLMDSPL
jgi:N-acetylglucosamine malate deacetylase 1